jgi:polygalacturonase
VSDVQVSNFAIDQPQLWSINIMNGTDMTFRDIRVTVNETAAPAGANWAQNTDGFGEPSLITYFVFPTWY